MPSLRRIAFRLSKTAARGPLIWLRHRGLDAADVMIASYPRSGNTWFRFIMAEVLTGRHAGFDDIDRMVPQVGKHWRGAATLPGGGRLIKTHEPYRQEYSKAIYLVRDVRDVLISLYSRGVQAGVFSQLSLQEFVPLFMTGAAINLGSWQTHVQNWLESPLARDGRVLVIRYEDLRQEPEATLASALSFLGAPVVAGEIRSAIQANTLANMRLKEDHSRSFPQSPDEQGRFVREGGVQSWRARLSSAQIELIDRYAGEQVRLLNYPAQ